MTRAQLIPWTMHTPGETRRVFLDTETGLTRLNLLDGPVSFDEAARHARIQTALLSVSLLDVADVGALRVGR